MLHPDLHLALHQAHASELYAEREAADLARLVRKPHRYAVKLFRGARSFRAATP